MTDLEFQIVYIASAILFIVALVTYLYIKEEKEAERLNAMHQNDTEFT